MFWLSNPSVLWTYPQILQCWPTNEMDDDAKLNAISRLVLLLTMVFYFGTEFSFLVLLCGTAILVLIASLFLWRKSQKSETKEGFTQLISAPTTVISPIELSPKSLEALFKKDFHPVTWKNPMGNVLLTEIGDTPSRKSAPPSFNPQVKDEITAAVKKEKQKLNPDFPDAVNYFYGNLKDNFDLDTSMRQFYTMPNSRVSNDQAAFAKFLYGDMPSSKEQTMDGARMRILNSQRFVQR